MHNLNEYRKAINVLILRGHVVIQVVIDEETSFFYSSLTFAESTQNSSESTEYNEVKGIDITDFLNKNISNPNGSIFIQNYDQFLLDAPVMKLRFSNTMKWLKYSTATS